MVASILRPGEVAVIQVDSEDSDDPHIGGIQNMARDSISFMLLAPVGSGTTIYVTDRSWNATSFGPSGGGDGTYTWTAASDLPAGTIVTITEAELTAAGLELADTGEAIYVYQGTGADTPTTFLHAIEFGDGNTTFNGSLANTGLVNGVSAVALAADNVTFGERTWNHQADVLFANVNNAANWSGNDNSPHTDPVEGTNGHVAPDIQVWIAGISGGHGLFSVNADATQAGGLGYNVGHHFQNTSNDGNGTTFTQRFWSPTHILFDTVAGKFFVVDSSGTFDRILQGNISDLLDNPGSAPTMTILWQDQPAGTADGDGITSIQIDRTNGHIYFTADNDLLRVGYDTANQTAVQLAELGLDADLGSKNWANELVLDIANGRAFVVSTESFNDFVEVPPGSGNYVVGTTLYQNSIHMIENISPSDTNATGNTITELQFSGIYAETLSSGIGAPDPGNFEDFFGKITDVDINTTTGELWFTTTQLNGGTNGETGGIFRATVSGSSITVTQIASEDGGNRNYMHIHVDEETGFYYVSSIEPGQSGIHAIYRGSLTATPGTEPTLFANVGNVNDMSPRDLTVESAPTLSGTALDPSLSEASAGANSGATISVPLFNSVSASDIDTSGGDELAGATVRISGNFVRETSTIAGHAPSQDFLMIGGSTNGVIAGSGIAYSYNATTGVMTLSGPGTVAEYAAALQLVQFSTSGDNPTLYGTAGTRTISASVFDGLLHSDEITTTVAVTGINDAPVNTVPGEEDSLEDASVVFSTANSNALSVGDADADPATQALQVTLSVTNGTLTLASLTGLTFSVGDGASDATMTFTGTANAINAALGAGLTFTPVADYNGPATLTITTSDQGLNGTGGALSDTDTVTITIDAVADIAGDLVSTDEDTAIDVFVLSNDTFENPDHEITGFTQGSNGTVTLNDNGTSEVATDDYFVYTPNADFNGSDSFTYTVTSGGVTETATVAVTVDAVADIVDDSVSVNEDSVDNVLDLLANDSFEDSDRAITSVGAASNGTVTIDDNGTPGDATDDFVTYTPDADFNGSDSFTYTVTTAGGVTETATVSVTVNPVNDPPESTDPAGDTVTWTEGDGPVTLDDGADGLVVDIDSTDFAGGSLTVAITSGLVAAEDLLDVQSNGTVTVTPGTILVGGEEIATFFGGGAGGGSLVFNFTAAATPARVSQLLQVITYTNSGGIAPTAGDRTISWTIVDGDGTANGGDDTLNFTSTVTVSTIDGPPVAVADAPTVDADVVTDIPVVGNDTDDDGGPKNVIEINGSAVSVGIPVALASGATVTLNPDGTIAYDPNGEFDYLVSAATATATGATNFSASDSFSYTLNGGSNTTVTVTVLGVDGPGDELHGTTAGDTITGTDGKDVIKAFKGDDTIDAGTGNDFVGGHRGADTIEGGFGHDHLRGGKGGDTLYGNSGSDRLVGASGADTLFGGAGTDRLIGGAGTDWLAGEGGRDAFVFFEGDLGSSRGRADTIADFDQSLGEVIRLLGVDADVTTGGDQAFTWIGDGDFTGTAGELHFVHVNGDTFVEGDTDGDGSADVFIRLLGTHDLVVWDFLL